MSVQLELRPDWESMWLNDRAHIRKMVDAIRPELDYVGKMKFIAGELDTSPSGLRHGLDETSDRNLPARWLRWILAHTTKELREQYVTSLAHMLGGEYVDAPPITEKEELANLKLAQAEAFGPEICQQLLAKAKRRR